MQLSLNSNLILLIQEPGMIQGVEFMNFKFQSDSINTYFLTVFAFLRQDFKFQSDSINTLRRQRHKLTACPLNSNLILLIRSLLPLP